MPNKANIFICFLFIFFCCLLTIDCWCWTAKHFNTTIPNDFIYANVSKSSSWLLWFWCVCRKTSERKSLCFGMNGALWGIDSEWDHVAPLSHIESSFAWENFRDSSKRRHTDFDHFTMEIYFNIARKLWMLPIFRFASIPYVCVWLCVVYRAFVARIQLPHVLHKNLTRLQSVSLRCVWDFLRSLTHPPPSSASTRCPLPLCCVVFHML